MNVIKSHKQLVEEGRITFRPDPQDPKVGTWMPADGGTYQCDPKTGELSLVEASTQLRSPKAQRARTKGIAKAPTAEPTADAAPKA